uniref:Lymphoid-restricted membrane protein n=1 Tax=Nothobranchius furzeri TaxID=105023 RepID=A0A8C6KSW2_NOTFU
MDYYSPQSSRRHNPVDSICRKLQTIQWRGDREPNSPFQIPKLFSSSYDSPQCGLRPNLDGILKRRAFYGDEAESVDRGGMGMPSSAASQKSNLSPFVPLSTPACSPPTPANVTYTVTSTLGETKGADKRDLRQVNTWQRSCSTSSIQSKGAPYFAVTQEPQSEPSKCDRKTPSLSCTFTPGSSSFFYNVNFCSADTAAEHELPHPALLVKRLSMDDGVASEKRRNRAEISVIGEENLLDTIFYACDTQRRGKVYVSHIVDYLRHTTSRTPEDTGLEELCYMLDPDQKDVSIDLDTYHAVMREWIDNCRNNGGEECRSMLLNMTSGSLEAFGGEASRPEIETSELVYCVTDLQMSNQKLREEVKKLKQVVESMEEGNQKLAEENEQLRTRARVNQLLAQKEKMLKEEVEEMKATLTCTEEGRARASAQRQHMVSQTPEGDLITMETDELQKKIKELRDINTSLQVPFIYPSLFIDCLSSPPCFHPAVSLSTGLSLSLAYRINQSSTGCLHTELALAQSPLEDFGLQHTIGPDTASPLDETLDKELLLMLQGPLPDHMSLEFKSLLNNLVIKETSSALSAVRDVLDHRTEAETNTDSCLQRVQAKLDSRRADWVVSLDQLAQYTDSLEKELIKMAGNMRRSRTEILHLSVRVQEQENQKRQLCEELEQLKTSQDSRETSCQMSAPEEEGCLFDSISFLFLLLCLLARHFSFLACVDGGQRGRSRNGLSSSDVGLVLIQTEFQRLALGFKCDMFTLEKRLRLEERSRDLAEENVRREVSSCQGLLQALIPLCDDDSQSMEIIQRLQKNLNILIQSMTRVSSRSEMLGAIHQENRIGKAVEVMIQHVENLRRTYTKEHSELLELREALMQSERSFGSEKGLEFCNQTHLPHISFNIFLISFSPSPLSTPPSTDPGPSPSLPHSQASSRAAAAAVARGGRGIWMWLAMVMMLVGLLALLASLVMQPAVDAAPVGTGDSWVTIQQLLWPYTGLRHNGQPPV